ncbi:hypothetical protein H312_02308, partial [Anncaliia algerae PRA339]
TIIKSKHDQIQNNILDWYIEIFNSSKYSFFYKVIPTFKFLYKINENKNNKHRSVIIILYSRPIICKFEFLKIEYFPKKVFNEDINQNILSNSKFKELILISSIFLQKINMYCNISENFAKILEILNLVLFIRFKCNSIFDQSNLLESIINLDNKYFVEVKDDNNQIIGLEGLILRVGPQGKIVKTK